MDSKDNRYIDLHIHTNLSDGTFSPQEVVRYAKEHSIAAVGITDHDNVEGILPAMKTGEKEGVEIVPGVEISAEYEEENRTCEIHILGYLINWQEENFVKHLAKFKEARQKRADLILKHLEDLGMKIDTNRMQEITGNASIGRLHIARLMLEKRYVKNIPEAFNRFLAFGKPAYEPKLSLRPEAAVKIIQKAEGVAVLAHPYYSCYNVKGLLRLLKKAGLAGIEVWHSKQPKETAKEFAEIAEEFNLLKTGGSDCHGSFGDKTPIMGIQKVPYSALTALRKHKSRMMEGR